MTTDWPITKKPLRHHGQSSELGLSRADSVPNLTRRVAPSRIWWSLLFGRDGAASLG